MRILLLLTLFLTSCGWTKKTEMDIPADSAGHSILFLALKIRKDPGGGKPAVDLLSKTASAGKIKPETPPQATPDRYLTIDTYRGRRIVHTLIMEHPLYRHIEYVTENGALAAKNIEPAEAEFFIRLQVQGDAVWISETTPQKAKTLLTKIKL